jgi:hypothetical protein
MMLMMHRLRCCCTSLDRLVLSLYLVSMSDSDQYQCTVGHDYNTLGECITCGVRKHCVKRCTSSSAIFDRCEKCDRDICDDCSHWCSRNDMNRCDDCACDSK